MAGFEPFGSAHGFQTLVRTILGPPLANLGPHLKLYDEALCDASVDGGASGASQRRNCGTLTLQVRRR